MNKEYLTVKDVAIKLDVKPVTVYKYLREGRLKGAYFKLGGIYRFKKELLDKYLENILTYND